MELNVRTWGSGRRTALLLHGFSDDSGTWWRVGPALAERGYTVLAPDLRGHGESPRCTTYRLEDFAQDIVDTLPAGADLAIGHSLGAVVLGMAVPSLLPRAAVFVDPSWLRPRREVSLEEPLAATPADLGPDAALWSERDIAEDLASNARLDPEVRRLLLADLGPDDYLTPCYSVVPGARVVVPELSPALPPDAHRAVTELGYTIRTVPGVRHVIHRDDFAAFMAAVA